MADLWHTFYTVCCQLFLPYWCAMHYLHIDFTLSRYPHVYLLTEILLHAAVLFLLWCVRPIAAHFQVNDPLTDHHNKMIYDEMPLILQVRRRASCTRPPERSSVWLDRDLQRASQVCQTCCKSWMLSYICSASPVSPPAGKLIAGLFLWTARFAF